MKDTKSLRAEVLALLLEPLGVDSAAGPAALKQLTENVAAIARARRCAGLPPSGTTLHWMSAAVAACVEEQELVRLAAARGRTLTADEAKALRRLMRLEGLRSHLHGFEGVTAEALRADLAVVALAERELPGVLERCRHLDQEWPEEVRRSVLGIDLDSTLANLRHQRWGSRRAETARELVLEHTASAAQELSLPDLVTRLEKVAEFVAAQKEYEAVLSGQPDWWRWLGPDGRFRFRADRRAALGWAIGMRDTGAVSGSTLEMLADADVKAVLEQALVTVPLDGTASPAAPVMSAAERLVTGLPAVAHGADVGELRALESWYARDIDLFDRVAAAMDVLRTDSALRMALEPLTDAFGRDFGTVDASRSAYRGIQSALRAETEAGLPRASYSDHAWENEHLVVVISRVGALERELRDAVRDMPVVRGGLRVAVAGRTKSGKTTLRKALTRDADRTGIGRGAHRTTRETAAFELGSVTYLDTPGVAAKDDDVDAQRAREACDGADAVIWNYADTLRDEESAELQRLLLSGKPLLAVVNVKERVDTPSRLQLFAQRPERAFASASGHVVRIEQVCGSAGVAPPVVLTVHSGAAHEALSTEDPALRDRAFRASRLPELEESLFQLLAERVVPLRAVRLADAVRAPLAAIHDRMTEELPGLGLALGELECSAPREQAALLDAIRRAGQSTLDRLRSRRHQAAKQLLEVVPKLGGADHTKRWSDFVTGLELNAFTSILEAEIGREILKQDRIPRVPGSAEEREDDDVLDVEERPDTTPWRWVGVAVEGAMTTLLDSPAGDEKTKGPAASARGNPAVQVAGYVAQGAVGAFKAISREHGEARRKKQGWIGRTSTDIEAELDKRFADVQARLTRTVDETTVRISAQFQHLSADISRTRERLEQLRRLRSSVRSALDAIDLVLIRRLLALAGGDPTAIDSARRTPGIAFHVRTDASRIAEVRAGLQALLVDVLPERIETAPDFASAAAKTGARGANEGKADD